MLAVIADDFTGASEIAGIAFAQGFDTLIQTGELKQTDSDVLVVATNMRAASPREAECISAQVTEHLLSLGAELIFKKIDSVLRGNIGPELHAQMRVEKKLRSLLIPANPSRSRTISDGVYFIEDIEVADSEFGQVDHFPYPSSRVVDILEHRGAKTRSASHPMMAFPARACMSETPETAMISKLGRAGLTNTWFPREQPIFLRRSCVAAALADSSLSESRSGE